MGRGSSGVSSASMHKSATYFISSNLSFSSPSFARSIAIKLILATADPYKASESKLQFITFARLKPTITLCCHRKGVPRIRSWFSRLITSNLHFSLIPCKFASTQLVIIVLDPLVAIWNTIGFERCTTFIRCIGSGFIVELECSMCIQIPISGPDEYLIVYRSRVTSPQSERWKFPEASIVCP